MQFALTALNVPPIVVSLPIIIVGAWTTMFVPLTVAEFSVALTLALNVSLPEIVPDGSVGAYGFSRYVYQDQGGEVLPTLIEGPQGRQVRCQELDLACSYTELQELYDSGAEIPEYLEIDRETLGVRPLGVQCDVGNRVEWFAEPQEFPGGLQRIRRLQHGPTDSLARRSTKGLLRRHPERNRNGGTWEILQSSRHRRPPTAGRQYQVGPGEEVGPDRILQRAKRRLTTRRENLGDGAPGPGPDFLVHIDEVPPEASRQSRSHRGLSRSHEAHQDDPGDPT